MIDKFTKTAEVQEMILELQAMIKNPDSNEIHKYFSDIIDNEGNQYVNIVLEGGGTLGLALLGYIYTLEQVGIRFLKIGGTSAGSIVALLLACGEINQSKAEWILERLCDKKFIDFVDLSNGDSKEQSQQLIDFLVSEKSYFSKLISNYKLLDNFNDLLQGDNLGLAKGNNFKNWLKKLLREKEIETLADLYQKRSIIPIGFRNRITELTPETLEDLFRHKQDNHPLVLIATEITTETKFEFPRQAPLVWNDIFSLSPAEFVRASMSIPIFFEPVKVKTDKAKWVEWRNKVKFKGDLPDFIYFVDGGMVSNFPIDIFENAKNNFTPTFGVKLGKSRSHSHKINSAMDLMLASFNSARHALDFDFIYKNPDFKKIVKEIEIDPNISWLDFNMSFENQNKLFISGVKAAFEFLKDFSWKNYKEAS